MYVNGRRQHVDELLARMQAVRGRLDEDAQATKQTVHDLGDWRSVVRKHPLIAAGLAAAVGYLLVPKKPPAPTFSKKDLEALARENKIVFAQDRKASAGLTGTIAAIVGAALTRAASNFVASKLNEFAANGGHEGHEP